jgi:Domain of unknown function (DUF4386)
MENSINQLKSTYKLGAIVTVIALTGILLDIIIGICTGGNLTELPQTAVDRFAQIHENKFLGLYNLDFLNIINQMILIPAYIALYTAHRAINKTYGLLALIVFLFGTTLMVVNNAAMPMLELSNNYFATSSESQKLLYAAAGESYLASGAHGSAGFFLGFFIPNIAGLIISLVMLRGKIFSKLNSWIGIAGNTLMLFYVVLITFGSGVETMATAFAMPGGLLLMTWMILFTVKFFKLAR